MRDTRHSQNGTSQKARSKAHGYLLASAVVFAGCGSMTAPIDDTDNDRVRPTTRVFAVTVGVVELDESLCRIEVIAGTRGGDDGAYAEWRDLRARAFDPNTGDYIGNARTQQLYPNVFDADRLYRGDEERGVIDLERFRRDEGQRVMVELEFYYTAWEKGEYQDRVATVNHDCL